MTAAHEMNAVRKPIAEKKQQLIRLSI